MVGLSEQMSLSSQNKCASQPSTLPFQSRNIQMKIAITATTASPDCKVTETTPLPTAFICTRPDIQPSSTNFLASYNPLIPTNPFSPPFISHFLPSHQPNPSSSSALPLPYIPSLSPHSPTTINQPHTHQASIHPTLPPSKAKGLKSHSPSALIFPVLR